VCLRTPKAAATTAVLGCAALVTGCGGGTRQDASEASGAFQMAVVQATFPAKQSIAHPETLELQVRNTGTKTVPNVAITVNSLDYSSNFAELAANKRPVWVIERGPGASANPPVQSEDVTSPGGGGTVYVNTWALGALGAKQTRRFTWHVVPVKAGNYTVDYSVSAGLAGKAKAQLSSGAPVQGHLSVTIAGTPANKFVDPSTGRIVTGTYP
jgi:hypothetical protein